MADNPEPTETPRHRWRPQFEHFVGGFVLLLTFGTALQSCAQDAATERLAECLATYSNGFAEAIDVRSKASGEAQAALDAMLTTVGDPTQSPESRRAAFYGYLDARKRAVEAQRANPYPTAPRDACPK